jgi:hypothetical protein
MWLRLLWIVLLIGVTSLAGQAKSRWQGCLPTDVDADEVISSEPAVKGRPGKQITVKSRLNQLAARCVGNRLVDSKGKQIHFYRLTGCWGNPPENYEEILDNQQKELARLRRRYRVIEISCNPSGVLIQ